MVGDTRTQGSSADNNNLSIFLQSLVKWDLAATKQEGRNQNTNDIMSYSKNISDIRTRIFLTNCLKVTYFSRFRDVRIPGDVREKSKIKATFLQNLEASVPSEPFPH